MRLEEMETLQIAKDTIEEIISKFPGLECVENEDDPVELSITLPVQDGLKYKIWLALQNEDELHFSVGGFWLEWFPCTDEKIVKEYIEAVCGFISGEYRVYEQYRGKRCCKAELQVPENGSWLTIGTYSSLHLPFPWSKTYNVLRNA